jgi:hypothetical protein
MQRKLCRQCGDIFFADETWKKICITCWKLSKGIKSKNYYEQDSSFSNFTFTPPPQPIDADMLKRLIYLCHPDKHSNSQASTLATDWLLKQRSKT